MVQYREWSLRVANSTLVIWGERDAFLDRACNETLPRCTAPTSSVWKTTASPATAAELTADYTRQFANPYYAAEHGYINAVIEPQQTRPVLIRALTMAATKCEARPSRKHCNIPL